MRNYNCILEILNLFNTAYQERDSDKINSFMESLFDKNENSFITGTSDNELCFDYEKIKEIFISDWKYWGDLKLDLENMLLNINDNFAWVHCPGTVKYTFSSDDETYANFIKFIKEFYDGESYDSKKDSKIKLTEINWLLAHLLHDREPKINREYFWALRVFFVFKKVNLKWIVKHIQFSLPQNSSFADERFSEFTYYEKAYNKETELFKSYSKSIVDNNAHLAIEAIKKCFCDKNIEQGEISAYLSDNSYFVNFNNTFETEKSNIALSIQEIKNFWDDVIIDTDIALMDNDGDNLWLHTTGLLKRKTSEKELIKNTENSILKIINKDINDKDKLFLIRKRISTMLNESAYGYDFTYPFKFNAFLIKQGDKFVFDYIQLSFPFNNILEQINEEI